jgi:hypothetical protein
MQETGLVLSKEGIEGFEMSRENNEESLELADGSVKLGGTAVSCSTERYRP